MDIETFTGCITALHAYFNRKLPTNEQVKLWHRQTKHIPTRIEKAVMDRIFKDYDSLPRNIPKAFNALYHEFLRSENPNLKKKKEYQNCDFCDSKGNIFAEKRDVLESLTYSFVFRCAHCDNWQNECGDNSPVPIATTHEIQNKGYVIV